MQTRIGIFARVNRQVAALRRSQGRLTLLDPPGGVGECLADFLDGEVEIQPQNLVVRTTLRDQADSDAEAANTGVFHP